MNSVSSSSVSLFGSEFTRPPSYMQNPSMVYTCLIRRLDGRYLIIAVTGDVQVCCLLTFDGS